MPTLAQQVGIRSRLYAQARAFWWRAFDATPE
jgi:hypothetical protein